jgi:serine acetyltransferase
MKSHWIDYALSGALISLLLAVAFGTCLMLYPWTTRLFGDYHVVVNVILGLWIYAISSAMLLRGLLKLRPMPPGEHSQESPAFTYWKLLTVIYRLGQSAIAWSLPFFMKPLRDAMFGARIGPNVAFGGTIDDPYMVTVGASSVLGNASLVSANYVSDDKLVCHPVEIGCRVTVGANCVIMPGVRIGDGAVIMIGSVVMPGTQIPAGERWRGNPARKWA